jgi:hypothetical protein
MKKTTLCCILILIFSGSFAQGTYLISRPELSLSNNILTIKYDISGCGRGEYVDISLILVTSKGDTLRPRYITGDIGNMISCGLGKSIQWNLEKDKVEINEDIEAFIKGVKSAHVNMNLTGPKKLSRGNVILSSVFIPGLGQMKASGKLVHLVFSGLVYGSLGGALYFTLKANDFKKKYNDASGDVRDDMFNRWQNSYDLSKDLIYCAAGAWVGNLIWSVVIPIRTSPVKNLKVSILPSSHNNLLVSAKWIF